MRVPGGGASCLGVGRLGAGALPPPTARPLGGLPGPSTHWLWVRGGAGVGTRHQPDSARSNKLDLRAVGAARGRPGGRLWPGCGASGVGRSPTPDCPPSGRAAGAHYPLAVGAGGCGRGDPSPAPQRALFRAGFARCGGGMRVPGGAPLAWVWGVRGRALSHPRLPALRAGCRGPLPTGCGCGGVRVWGPVTNPTARALASWLCAMWGRHEGAREGAPLAWVWGVRGRALSRPRLPALWAGCWSPLPTGCGRGGAWAWGPVTNPTARALASWLCALWGRHEGARGGRLLPGCGASEVGRFPDPDGPPFGRAAGLLCVCVPFLAGSGGPASRARFGAPHFSFGLSCFALCLLHPLWAGVALFVVVVGFFFFFIFVAFPLLPLAAPPLCPASRVFRPRVPWALASCPPPRFFFLPPLCAPPISPALRSFRPGVPWALASCSPPPPFFFAPPPLLSPAFLVPRLPLASAPSHPPLFFFLVLLLFFLLRVRCVCSGVSCCVFPVLPVRCAVRVVCAVSGGWCCWFLVSLPFVGGLPVALVARRCSLVVCVASGARVLSGRRVASSLWCPVPLYCVLWRCAAVWCCAVVPCLLFFCFSPCWWRWFPVVPRWFWARGQFRVVSVSVLCLCGAVLVCLRRCSLFGALLPSRDWPVFCVVACCVCVFAVGPGRPLLSPGGSWCRVSVACCGVSLGAVLRRVAARCAPWRCVVVRCVVAFCSVWCCRALCCVLGRCPSSWGPVPSGAVFCLVPPRCVCFAVVCRCVVLFAVVLCAVCALGCRVVRFLSSTPCAVLLCGPSVPCFPVLCPVVLCSRVVPWCPVLWPCWVCFLRGCGCDAFPWGAWPRDAAVTRTSKQAGKALHSQGHQLRSCHETKRFRILATLKQGNKSMYSNTSGYVHMGLRLDWGKGITGQ